MRFSVVGGEGFDQGTDALVCLMEKDEKNEQLEKILGSLLASLRERKVFEGSKGQISFLPDSCGRAQGLSSSFSQGWAMRYLPNRFAAHVAWRPSSREPRGLSR